MYGQIDSNKRKTWFVMGLFIVLIASIAGIVYLSTDDSQMTIGILFVSAVYAIIQYFMASQMALKISGAQPISKADNPRIYNIVENLTITTGLPMPAVYIIDDPAPNAFATGKDPLHASVAVTTGLMNTLTDRELTGVMAHEMAHVGNYDIRVSLIAFAFTVMISTMVNIILRSGLRGRSRDRDNGASSISGILLLFSLVLTPLLATFIQLAVSRNREFLADATGSLTTRDPEGLASALEKLRDNPNKLRNANPSMANMYINAPIGRDFLSSLVNTHPPIDERIARLRNGQF